MKSNEQETDNNNNIKNNDNTNNNERTTEDEQPFTYDELETDIEYDDDGLKTFDDSDKYFQDDQLVDENIKQIINEEDDDFEFHSITGHT